MAQEFKTFTPVTGENARTGVVEAVRKILSRHDDNETATSIVLPPRYGKSDVIRLAAMELTETGRTCSVLALAPWDVVASQLIENKHAEDMIERYQIKKPFFGSRLVGMSDTFHETEDLIHLFTATISLAQQNLSKIERWIERCKNFDYRPVLMVDEGQLLSSNNKWGKIAKLVQDKGAHFVVLTGTPYRSDKDYIPGFNSKKISTCDIERKKSRSINEEYLEVTPYVGTESLVEMVADVRVSMSEAWDKKAICELSSLEVDGEIEGELNKDGTQKMLSDIPVSLVPKLLRAVVTNPATIRACMELAIKDMYGRRRAGMKNSAIMVVTASDLNPDGMESDDEDGSFPNWHARRVRDAVKALDGNLDVVIATQACDDGGSKAGVGKRRLRKFSGYTNDNGDYVEGTGDVLIVKNMGTVGFDCERVKTLVLLSTVRQRASWEQVILRCATMWDLGDGCASHGTVVFTQDILNLANWEQLVSSQGGDVKEVNLEALESYIIKKDPKKEEKRKVFINPTFARSKNSKDEAEIDPATMVDVQAILKAYPKLGRFSYSQIRDMVLAGVKFSNVPTGNKKPKVRAVNVSQECKRFANRIAELTKIYADLHTGRTYIKGNKDWVDARRDIYYRSGKHARLRDTPSKETDPARLQSAIKYIETQIRMKGGILL